MKKIRELIDKEIKERGIKMSKLISAGNYGIFFNQSPVYDSREARSYKQACELAGEGFSIDGTDIGILLLNAIMHNPHD